MKTELKPEIMEGIMKHIMALGSLEKAELLEIAPGHGRCPGQCHLPG